MQSNVGRFWTIGLQDAPYVPGVRLQAGFNGVIALDLFAHETPSSLASR